MKNLILILVLLLPVWVKAEAPTSLYSEKYQRTFSLGLKPHAKSRELPDKSFLEADVKVPNDFYMPEKWPLPAGLPYDQGQCGSCVVNSIVGNLTYSLSIRGLLPTGVSPLSRGQVMNCNPTAGQCSGDYAENVGGWVVKHGKVLSESTYPYSPNNGNCKNISGTEYGPVVSGRVIDSSPKSIGTALVLGVPVSTTVGADNPWMNAETTLYTTCTNQGTNHEVLIIGIHATGAARGADGFIDFANAKPGDIWIDILNSWGSRWADNGIIHTLIQTKGGRLCNNVTEEVYVFDTGVPVVKPVDGGWSAFGAWSDCVNGSQSHSRTCSNPAPSNGGKDCVGEAIENQSCVVPPGPTPATTWPLYVYILMVGLLVTIALEVIEFFKK